METEGQLPSSSRALNPDGVNERPDYHVEGRAEKRMTKRKSEAAFWPAASEDFLS
jgi:hypothetical protein